MASWWPSEDHVSFGEDVAALYHFLQSGPKNWQPLSLTWRQWRRTRTPVCIRPQSCWRSHGTPLCLCVKHWRGHLLWASHTRKDWGSLMLSLKRWLIREDQMMEKTLKTITSSRTAWKRWVSVHLPIGIWFVLPKTLQLLPEFRSLPKTNTRHKAIKLDTELPLSMPATHTWKRVAHCHFLLTHHA